MSKWRPALRMARRDLRRHKVRALLTCVLVALPIFIGTVAALVTHNERWTLERSADAELYGQDAKVVVTPFTALRPDLAVREDPRRAPGAERRDPAEVDLAALLPDGTRLAPQPWFTSASLATGGMTNVIRADLTNPMTSDVADIVIGEAPTAPDEVAIPVAAARELDLLDGDQVKPGATVDLVGDTSLRLSGALEGGRTADFEALTLLVPPDTVLRELDEANQPQNYYLADLPPMTIAETRALVDELAAQGIGLRPRDAIVHPKAWGQEDYSGSPIDLTPILVGALCLLVGLLEVVLLVGAAFSVAARRQVRDLGLLATNGGAAPDVRRVLLAQGLVLGVLSSVVGAAAGVVVFKTVVPEIAIALDRELWRTEISWVAVVFIAALGSLSSVVAALLPSLRVSRLTPIEALSGRFPIKPGEAKAHRPAFVLAGAGLVIMLACGWGLSYVEELQHTSLTGEADWLSPVAVLGAGLGLVLLVIGLIWSAPYVVRRVSQLGKGLSLSGRYAFRDAGRHRFRTTAAVMALMITVAGAVLAAFGFSAAARSQLSDGVPPNTISIDLWDARGPEQVLAAQQTVERIVEPVASATSFSLHPEGNGNRTIMVGRTGFLLQAVDEESLRQLVRADAAALAVFRSGGALTLEPEALQGAEVRLTADGRKADPGVLVPAVSVLRGDLQFPYDYSSSTYISLETAASLGFERSEGRMLARTNSPISSDTVHRLQVYGIYGWTDDPERALLDKLQYAGLAAAALLTALVVGIAVAMAAAESRDDVATLAAVGAGPWRRRGFGGMHGLFLGIVSCLLGLGIGLPAGLSFSQLDALPGTEVPWLALAGTVAVVLPLSWVMGAIVTPSRFRLTRRVA
ncbi:MAG TPA: FtsX-like permease family protein [Nocardioidaceae bacterium]|nr:FtsX-like permease family protein [Nocardioidaceae bacterium]